jgi:hypothetical protein
MVWRRLLKERKERKKFENLRTIKNKIRKNGIKEMRELWGMEDFG